MWQFIEMTGFGSPDCHLCRKMKDVKLYDYDEDSIRTLEWNQHIRTRPGMYIGVLGDGSDADDGIYVLLKEIIDNSIDEFSMGFGNEIIVNVEGNHVTVRDFGRGIPLGSVVKAVSVLNTGGRFDDRVFQKSIGMNGVGTKAVNALSVEFEITSYRNGEYVSASFSKGELISSDKGSIDEKNGTYVAFTPDKEMFEGYSYHMDIIEQMVKDYTYVKKGLRIILNGEIYESPGGLADLLKESVEDGSLYEPVHLIEDDLEIIFTHTNKYGEHVRTFVNGQYTRYGGTHLAAFREAVARVLKEHYKRNYTPEDCRQGMVAALSIRIQEPNFDGQKKSRLGSVYMWEKNGQQGPTIKSCVLEFMSRLLPNYLLKHKELSASLEAKIKQSQSEREQIAAVRSSKGKSTRRANVYNENLNDCQYHFCDKKTSANTEFLDKTTLFITEGNSAAGTVNKARNPKYQAAFSIRGKSINCYKESARKVAENKEFNNLVAALGVEDGIKGLRYAKVVIASDADTDGMHIRMLLMTFFLKFYPDLVSQGYIYILDTPLFRVRNRKESRYCYSEQEKEQALIDLGRGSEITRFKGLGELGEKEFKDFIGPAMKLEQVSLEDGESIQMILEFYMGSNTKDRQDFIFANLKSQTDLDGI